MPIGSAIEVHGLQLPIGYEWPNGQTLASAATQYPEYNAAIGSGITVDKRGRVAIPYDNLGGSSAGRLSGGIISGGTQWATGGSDTVTLSTSQIPSHTHSGTTGVDSPDHNHGYDHYGTGSGTTGGGAFPLSNVTPAFGAVSGGANVRHAHGFTTDGGTGGGAAHSNLQPSVMTGQVLVVE
jgi:microcystin-dependent protein